VTAGHDLMLIHLKSQDFSFWEFSLLFISKISMLAPTKWASWINGWICLEFDDQDHFLEQLQLSAASIGIFPFSVAPPST
jgi:hypothetical protein